VRPTYTADVKKLLLIVLLGGLVAFAVKQLSSSKS